MRRRLPLNRVEEECSKNTTMSQRDESEIDEEEVKRALIEEARSVYVPPMMKPDQAPSKEVMARLEAEGWIYPTETEDRENAEMRRTLDEIYKEVEEKEPPKKPIKMISVHPPSEESTLYNEEDVTEEDYPPPFETQIEELEKLRLQRLIYKGEEERVDREKEAFIQLNRYEPFDPMTPKNIMLRKSLRKKMLSEREKRYPLGNHNNRKFPKYKESFQNQGMALQEQNSGTHGKWVY
ncbi:hypothetical protein MHBO_004274, partial [Bonamia ostreae]